MNNEHSIHLPHGYYGTQSPLCRTRGFTLDKISAPSEQPFSILLSALYKLCFANTKPKSALSRTKQIICQGSAKHISCQGFTLLELIAVIAILGTVLVLVFPRLSILEDLILKSEVRRMAGLFRYLNEAAYTRKIYYRVSFYPEEESLTVESSPDGFEFRKAQDVFLHNLTLREGTGIEDIIVQGLGKINHGSVAIIFNPGIGAEAFNLHIKKNGRAFTISYNPYSGKVKVTDGYV